MSEKTKCQVEGCGGDLVKSGGALRAGGKVQRFQCIKCGHTHASNILFDGSGKSVRQKGSEKTKCQVEGCGGNLVKSGGALRSGGKVQRFQCSKCGDISTSDIPFEGS